MHDCLMPSVTGRSTVHKMEKGSISSKPIKLLLSLSSPLARHLPQLGPGIGHGLSPLPTQRLLQHRHKHLGRESKRPASCQHIVQNSTPQKKSINMHSKTSLITSHALNSIHRRCMCLHYMENNVSQRASRFSKSPKRTKSPPVTCCPSHLAHDGDVMRPNAVLDVAEA